MNSTETQDFLMESPPSSSSSNDDLAMESPDSSDSSPATTPSNPSIMALPTQSSSSLTSSADPSLILILEMTPRALEIFRDSLDSFAALEMDGASSYLYSQWEGLCLQIRRKDWVISSLWVDFQNVKHFCSVGQSPVFQYDLGLLREVLWTIPYHNNGVIFTIPNHVATRMTISYRDAKGQRDVYFEMDLHEKRLPSFHLQRTNFKHQMKLKLERFPEIISADTLGSWSVMVGCDQQVTFTDGNNTITLEARAGDIIVNNPEGFGQFCKVFSTQQISSLLKAVHGSSFSCMWLYKRNDIVWLSCKFGLGSFQFTSPED